jgi:type IV secretory pathway TrbD component
MRTPFKWIIFVEVLGTVLITVGRAWIPAGVGVLVILMTVYVARSDKTPKPPRQ